MSRSVGMILAVVVLAACGGDGEGDRGSPTLEPETAPPGRPEGTSEWVAVFEVAEDPNDLDDRTAELLPKLEGSLLVSPAGCHRGLDEELDVSGGTYFLGVRGDDPEDLADAIERAGLDPVLEGEFEVLCGT